MIPSYTPETKSECDSSASLIFKSTSLSKFFWMQFFGRDFNSMPFPNLYAQSKQGSTKCFHSFPEGLISTDKSQDFSLLESSTIYNGNISYRFN